MVGGDAPSPAVASVAVGFKFKPKVAALVEVAAPAGVDTGAQLIGALAPATPAAGAQKANQIPNRTPPLFPVIAGPGASRTNPSIPLPHVGLRAAAVEEPETFADEEPSGKGKRVLVWLLLLAAVGAGGYFGWPYLQPQIARFTAPKTASNPPVPAPTVSTPVASIPVVTKPVATTPATPGAGLTPSATLNQLAHAPVQAIDRAQDAIATRRASGQARIDAATVGDDIPERPKPSPPVAQPKPVPPVPRAPAPVTMAPVSRGLAASVQVEAGGEASPAFRTFVAGAKVSGVFQGAPARAMINGKLLKAGETVEPELGVIFAGVDSERRQLQFKDRSGATVSRKY